MDVKTAFLHPKLDHEVFMALPEGYSAAKTRTGHGGKEATGRTLVNSEFKEDFNKFARRHPQSSMQAKKLVWLLKKGLYGLKQAPRLWQKDVDEYLSYSLSLVHSDADHSVFLGLDVAILVYVDDILIFSPSKDRVEEVTQALHANYSMTDIGEPESFLGIRIVRDRKARTITID